MKKTLLIFLFAAALLLGASALTEDGYTYAIEDGCATVTAYTGGDTVVTVPETLGGCPVTRDVSGDGQFTLIDILRILRAITE